MCRVAFGGVINQIINDWVEMLVLSSSGMGRSAFRASRSMFELSLFVMELIERPDTAERYLLHEIIARYQVSEFDIAERWLTGKDLIAARHHRHKVIRDLAGRVDELVDRYGKQYRITWSDRSTRDRAEEQGRLDEYSGYRFSSALLHGAASGSLGTVLVYDTTAGDHPVFRIGPNLFFCSQALRFGVIAMRLVLERVAALVTDRPLHFYGGCRSSRYSSPPSRLHCSRCIGRLRPTSHLCGCKRLCGSTRTALMSCGSTT